MKKMAKAGIVLGMILLTSSSFCQTDSLASKRMRSPKVTQGTYLDLVLNIVGTHINYGAANSSLSDYKKAALGGQLGISFRAGISPNVSLVSELYFSMKGGSLQANNPFTVNETTVRFYAFEMPVLARFHFGNIHVNAGPSIAYNFYGSRKVEGSTSSLSFDHSTDGFKRWDAGIQAGAGYTFHTKRKNILLDIRYNYGLTNIARTGEMYNRALIVALHFSRPWKTNPFARR